MPYRRLPNTDASRIKALKLALQKGENLPPRDKPYSQSSLQNITKILPQYEALIRHQKEALKAQTSKSNEYSNLFKKARNYVSHFIQVMNLAIIRGDLRKEARSFFGFEEDVKKLPIFRNEQDVIKWGEIVLQGEPERIANGGNPMTNPTIGIVKVHYEKFIEAYRHQKTLQDNYIRYTKQVADFRPEVDKVILQLWNEIEASFEPNDEVMRRNKCREFGVVYFFRRNEEIPDNENVDDKYRVNRVMDKALKAKISQDLGVENKKEFSTELEYSEETETFHEEIVEDNHTVEGSELELDAEEKALISVEPEKPKKKEQKNQEEDNSAANFQYSLF
ncbi:MAG: hypothetical protein JXR60_10525 [Bacteroidales bacterium]|nr:hypothetical protein [Bacteroidales bacterium]